MPSYIPDICFGPVRDADGRWTGQTGLVPFPAHMRPRELAPLPDVDVKDLFGEAKLPRLVEAGGVFFLSLAPNDRASIAYSIERLIDMLDAMEPDPDLEPWLGDGDGREGDDLSVTGGTSDDEPSLGWTSTGHMGKELPPMFGVDGEQDDADDEPMLGAVERHPTSFEPVFCGVADGRSGQLHHEWGGRNSQEHWSAGATSAAFDDCEDVSEDEGATTGDDEYSLGWENEDSQEHLNMTDGEADLATTEEVDQVRRLEISDGWQVHDGEPLLGWCENAGRGIWKGEPADDREYDAGDDREIEYDGGEEETHGESPAPIVGGGSVCQYEDGWRPAPGSGVAPAMVEKAKRRRNGVVVREFTQPSHVVTERLMPDDAIPEINLWPHFLAAHGARPC